MVDFPRSSKALETRAEEELLGVSRGYLCDYPAQSLIHWQRDSRGEFEWAVLRSERSIAEAERQIRVELLKQKMAAQESELEGSLRKKFKVEIDEQALAKLSTGSSPSPAPSP